MQRIVSYYTNEWGYNERFIRDLVEVSCNGDDTIDTDDLMKRFKTYIKNTKDCNYRTVLRDIDQFLRSQTTP